MSIKIYCNIQIVTWRESDWKEEEVYSLLAFSPEMVIKLELELVSANKLKELRRILYIVRWLPVLHDKYK